MHASASIRDPAGIVHELVHGDIIGRVWSAALHIDDGRVSEAHAMVSLREGDLHLIGLRGGFAVDGRPVSRVVLEPGLRVQLARGLEIEVVAVRLPTEVLGIEGGPLPRQVLPGVCSIVLDAAPRLVNGWQQDAAAQLWSTGESWRLRDRQGQVRELHPDDEIRLGEHTLRMVTIPLRAAGLEPTRRAGELGAPLTLVAQFESVHIQRDGEVVVVLSGKQARLVSELVALDGPVSWSVLAAELWPEETDAAQRRPRLDVLLSRIRRRLRMAGVREDLVRSDGTGCMELLLHPHDTLVDRT